MHGKYINGIINHEDIPYKELEYIQNTRGAYFNTLYKCQANDTIIFDGIIYPNTSDSYNVLFGYAQNNAYRTNGWSLFVRFGNSNVPVLSRTGVEEQKSNMIYNQRITLTFYQKTCSWTNGTNTYSYSCGGTADNCTGYMGLLVKNIVNGGDGFNPEGLYATARIYAFQIKNSNNELVRDFVPCKRKSDNNIGLYDKVSGQFFTNQGTGTIIAGPEI